MRYYRTVKAATNALSLDIGFNPFEVDGVIGASGRTWRRATKEALRDIGYIVDRAKADTIARGHHCTVCQIALAEEWDGMRMQCPTECPDHRKDTY